MSPGLHRDYDDQLLEIFLAEEEGLLEETLSIVPTGGDGESLLFEDPELSRGLTHLPLAHTGVIDRHDSLQCVCTVAGRGVMYGELYVLGT